MTWLDERGAEAEERIRSMPYEHLGPAARRLRDSFDAQDVRALLDDVRDGVYG